jgi:hypothetical protein
MSMESSTTSHALNATADAVIYCHLDQLPASVRRHADDVGPEVFDRLKAGEPRYVSPEFEQWFVRAGPVVDAAPDETGLFVLVHQA